MGFSSVALVYLSASTWQMFHACILLWFSLLNFGVGKKLGKYEKAGLALVSLGIISVLIDRIVQDDDKDDDDSIPSGPDAIWGTFLLFSAQFLFAVRIRYEQEHLFKGQNWDTFQIYGLYGLLGAILCFFS
eukprot:UN31990